MSNFLNRCYFTVYLTNTCLANFTFVFCYFLKAYPTILGIGNNIFRNSPQTQSLVNEKKSPENKFGNKCLIPILSICQFGN